MAEVLRFRGFELIPAAYELRRGARVVKLEKLAMELLLLLVSRRESLVSRKEIVEKLWGENTYLDAEDGVNTAVRKVRRALGDDSERPRFIQTLPGKGYRFIAHVVIEARESKPGKRILIAILPFANLGQDASEDYFCDGMTEETIANLGAISPENLGVIARTSSMVYRNTTKPVSQIGKELGVDYILESSARRENRHLRITAQLIRVEDQTHVWAASYDRDGISALALQMELGRAIAEQVIAQVPSQGRSRMQTANPDAFDLYLRGRYYFAQRNMTGITRAIEFYLQALAIDPKYSLANAGIADAYATLPITSDFRSDECRLAGISAAGKAVAEDQNSAEAHSAVAACNFWLTWNWNLAVESANRAIELNPSYALAHFYLAHVFSNLRRHQEAEDAINRARALDPFSVHFCAIHGQMLYQAGRFDAAAAEARKATALNPSSWLGHIVLGKTQIETGDLEAALGSLQRAFDLSSGGNTEPLSLKAFAFAKLGQLEQAQEIVSVMKETAALRYVPPYNIAMAYNGLGDYDRAFKLLTQAAEQRDVRLIFLAVDPKWREMNKDKRVRSLWPRPQQHPAFDGQS